MDKVTVDGATEVMGYLTCQLGGGNHFDFEMPPKPFTIGRSSQADLQIADERVSRIHCGIRREETTFVIKDLGSTNGTFVNDERIQEARLQFGDSIRIGHTLLMFDSKPRRQPTSRIREILEVDMPSNSFPKAMRQLSKEAIHPGPSPHSS